MAESYDLILKGGTVVNQDGEGVRDVAVAGGRIAGIGELSGSAAEIVDCRGLHVLPGVIDSHVHMREPGLTHKEDLETGSHAAVMGGVTAVFEMPNTEPTTTNAEALADKVRRAHHRMHCDFAFYIGATRENTHQLGDLERLPGACGVKVFMGSSTGSLLIEDDKGVRNVLKAVRRRAAFHSEDEYRLRERMHLRVEGDPRSHPVWRDRNRRADVHRAADPAGAGKPANASTSCTSRPRKRRNFWRSTRMWPPPRRRRRISRSPRLIATSGSARWRSSTRRCATPPIARASGAASRKA